MKDAQQFAQISIFAAKPPIYNNSWKANPCIVFHSFMVQLVKNSLENSVKIITKPSHVILRLKFITLRESRRHT